MMKSSEEFVAQAMTADREGLKQLFAEAQADAFMSAVLIVEAHAQNWEAARDELEALSHTLIS